MVYSLFKLQVSQRSIRKRFRGAFNLQRFRIAFHGLRVVTLHEVAIPFVLERNSFFQDVWRHLQIAKRALQSTNNMEDRNAKGLAMAEGPSELARIKCVHVFVQQAGTPIPHDSHAETKGLLAVPAKRYTG